MWLWVIFNVGIMVLFNWIEWDVEGVDDFKK